MPPYNFTHSSAFDYLQELYVFITRMKEESNADTEPEDTFIC